MTVHGQIGRKEGKRQIGRGEEFADRKERRKERRKEGRKERRKEGKKVDMLVQAEREEGK
jgi:hypothetical protein